MAWAAGILLFLALLFAYPRQTAVFVCLALLAFGVAAFIERSSEAREMERQNRVEISARVDAQLCPDENYPIFVSVRNRSAETLTFVTFSLAGYRPGHSRSVREANLESDRIILPREGSGMCWGVPRPSFWLPDTPIDPGTLHWEARRGWADFQAPVAPDASGRRGQR